MSENILETIRRQMRISEERMNKAADAVGRTTPACAAPYDAVSAKPILDLAPETTGGRIEDPAWEWIAYGQMTPGFLKEVAGLMDEIIGNASTPLPNSTAPQIHRQIQIMKRVRTLLARWADSADAYRDPLPDCTFKDMIQIALLARGKELQRWGIRADFEDATGNAGNCRWTPALYQSVLHTLQCCIEMLRGGSGKSRLVVRLQHLGDRLDASFLCEFAGGAIPVNCAETKPIWGDSLRFDNIEVRAAQTLLDSIGGTFVLENISETRKAIRLSFNAISRLVEGNA